MRTFFPMMLLPLTDTSGPRVESGPISTPSSIITVSGRTRVTPFFM